MKILLTGIACRPDEGSEPGAGWNWLLALSKKHDVTMITSLHNKNVIEKWCSSNTGRFTVTYCGSVETYRTLIKMPFGYNLFYIYWLRCLKKKLAEFKNADFDVVQHTTFSTFKYFVPDCKLNIPFVLGPAGGGENTPPVLMNALGRRIHKERLRALQMEWALINPRIRQMLDRTALILATTQETASALPEKYSKKITVMQAIGISGNEIIEDRNIPFVEGYLNLVYAGRIEMWKGIIPLVDAVSALKGRVGFQCIVNVYGDGPDLGKFIALVKEKGVADCFHFTGRIPRARLLKNMDKNDGYIYTSFRDSGSMAVIEAMCRKLPVICFDVGGQRDTIHAGNGYVAKVSSSYEATVTALSDQIIKLYEDYLSGYVKKKLDNATKMLKEEYLWDSKAEKMTSLYKQIT